MLNFAQLFYLALIINWHDR